MIGYFWIINTEIKYVNHKIGILVKDFIYGYPSAIEDVWDKIKPNDKANYDDYPYGQVFYDILNERYLIFFNSKSSLALNKYELRLFSLFGIGENDCYIVDNDLKRLLGN